MLQPSDDARRWWILYSMGLVTGLVLLDETILGTALPSIREDLQLSTTTAHWVINAYLLVFSCFVAAGGKIVSLVGPRRSVTAAGSIFLVASLIGALAQTGDVLIGARIVQGFAAAMLFPIPAMAVSSAFPDKQRGMALGYLASTATMFLAAGPLLGGVFSDYLSWRYIFWFNIPVGLLAIIAANILFPKTPARQDLTLQSFDLTGLGFLAVAMAALTFSLMQGASYGWSSPVIVVLLVTAPILFGVFYRYELRKSAPLFHVELFAYPGIQRRCV